MNDKRRSNEVPKSQRMDERVWIGQFDPRGEVCMASVARKGEHLKMCRQPAVAVRVIRRKAHTEVVFHCSKHVPEEA